VTFPRRLAAREALANLRANWVRSTVAQAVGLVIGALMVGVTLFDVGRIAAYNEELVQAGANMFTVQREDAMGLDAGRCDALVGMPGIKGAGGFQGVERAVSLVDPGISFDLVTASPGYAAMIWPPPDAAAAGSSEALGRAVAGGRVAERLGVSQGGGLSYSAAGVPGHIEVRPAAGPARSAESDNWVVVPVAPVGVVAHCMVEAVPGARAAVESLLVGWFDEPVRTIVSAVMPEPPLGMSPSDQLASRLSRWIPLVATAALLTFQAALWLARRADLGLYGLLGLRRSRLAIMVLTDYLFTAVVPVCAGAVAMAAWRASELKGLVLSLTALDFARAGALMALAPAAIIGLLALTKPFDAIRGR
jgi:hypothetical protein